MLLILCYINKYFFLFVSFIFVSQNRYMSLGDLMKLHVVQLLYLFSQSLSTKVTRGFKERWRFLFEQPQPTFPNRMITKCEIPCWKCNLAIESSLVAYVLDPLMYIAQLSTCQKLNSWSWSAPTLTWTLGHPQWLKMTDFLWNHTYFPSSTSSLTCISDR